MAINFSSFDYEEMARRKANGLAIENWRNGMFCKRPYKLPVWRPKVESCCPYQRSLR